MFDREINAKRRAGKGNNMLVVKEKPLAVI
jgi:hypothetical protein